MNQIIKAIFVIFIIPVILFATDGFVTNFYRITPSDGQAQIGAVEVYSHNSDFNGTNFDRHYNNTELSVFVSAARTTTQNSSDFINYNGRGIQVILNITAASGTGGLQVQVFGKDPVSGTYYALVAAPTAVTATGIKVYEVYPAASSSGAGDITVRTAGVLPRTFRVKVTVGDASSYTYSVGAAVLN